VGGFFAFALAHSSGRLFAGEGSRARKMLVIWADGGPSQFETFDPKPDTETGGPLGAIETAARGLRISETLPGMARHMDKLSVVRNLRSPEGEHQRARYFLHTGFPLVDSFPRPALGAVAAQQGGDEVLPGYVSLGAPGFGPAYLGSQWGPFAIEDPGETRRLLRVLESRRDRISLARSFSERFRQAHPDADPALARLAVLERIEKLVDTPFERALDLERDREERARYGRGTLADRLLVARRLLELGTPFVEVHQGGWDTHQDNAANVGRLCRELDGPWATLMDDLAAGGLLEETVVVWLGEFGRTPAINGANGRDHFPQVTPVVIGGGGIAGGRVIGATNADGTAIEGESFEVADLFATLLGRLGVAPRDEFPTDFGSMTEATDGGRVIADLL